MDRCAPKPVTNANSTVNTGLYSHDIKAEIVAVRDKWWVAELHSKCPHKKIGEKRSCNACMYIIEQQLKREVGQCS